MNSSASELHYRFLGNRWTDQRDHTVSTLAERGADGGLRADITVRNSRIRELPWRVKFLVSLNGQLVFDGSVYKVTEIAPDYTVRERVRNAIEQNIPLAPGAGDVHDVVAVTKIVDSVFEEGQMVLPMTPSVLFFSVTKKKELEVIFDGMKLSEGQEGAARIRWRILKEYDVGKPHPPQDPYKIIEAKLGTLTALPGVGKLKVDDIIAATEHHSPWLVFRVLRNSR